MKHIQQQQYTAPFGRENLLTVSTTKIPTCGTKILFVCFIDWFTQTNGMHEEVNGSYNSVGVHFVFVHVCHSSVRNRERLYAHLCFMLTLDNHNCANSLSLYKIVNTFALSSQTTLLFLYCILKHNICV